MSKAKTLPFLTGEKIVKHGAIAEGMFSVSADDRLLLENVIDKEGQLKLYSPIVQAALLKALRPDILKACKEAEKEKEELKKESKAKAVKEAAAVARGIVEDAENE